jgi:hypothetical protein
MAFRFALDCCQLIGVRAGDHPCVDRSLVQLDLRFGHGTASVRFRAVFFGTSIVGNATDDFFRVVTAGEGALRIGQSCSDWLSGRDSD